MALREATFAEREGAKPLPRQLETKKVPKEARSKIWRVLYNSIQSGKFTGSDYRSYNSAYEAILRDFWTEIDCKFVDAFRRPVPDMEAYAKEKMSLGYAEFFEFIEFIVRHPKVPAGLDEKINDVLKETGSAYRIFEKTIVPISSQEMADAVEGAFERLSDFSGARLHLQLAASSLSDGNFANSVRESVNAVEAVARKLSPEAKTLGPALAKIEKSHRLHPALKKGFSALYGYTSDEEGIRHALIQQDAPSVSEQDALYMLGSCASFTSYLAACVQEQGVG